MESVKSAAPPGAILQLKVRLLGISPMIWRRVLVAESMSLRELHGVVQLAMGWKGIHLFEFAVRGVRYAAGPGLSGTSTDVALSDLRFRRNAKFRYVYDMFCDSSSTVEKKTCCMSMSYRAQEKPWHYMPVFDAIQNGGAQGLGSAISFSTST